MVLPALTFVSVLIYSLDTLFSQLRLVSWTMKRLGERMLEARCLASFTDERRFFLD